MQTESDDRWLADMMNGNENADGNATAAAWRAMTRTMNNNSSHHGGSSSGGGGRDDNEKTIPFLR
jgi:hypothetical protein